MTTTSFNVSSDPAQGSWGYSQKGGEVLLRYLVDVIRVFQKIRITFFSGLFLQRGETTNKAYYGVLPKPPHHLVHGGMFLTKICQLCLRQIKHGAFFNRLNGIGRWCITDET